MEWVRSCFRSKWKLFRGSDRLRAGFYYFAKPGTPHYPGFHNLWSRDWISDNGWENAALGEFQGGRKYYRGDPPPVVPLPVRVGDEVCIRDGENPALPSATDDCERRGRLMPLACYDPDWNFEDLTNVWDCKFAYHIARIIETQYTDLEAAGDMVPELLGDGTSVTKFPELGGAFPNQIVARKGTAVFVLLTGTTSFQQFAVQALYFGIGATDFAAYSASALYEAAATIAMDRLSETNLDGVTRFVLMGHSYGGAIAYVMAARMKLANPTRRIEMMTFGTPKAGDLRLTQIVAALKQIHYCGHDDPVPFLPPDGVTFFDLIPLIPVWMVLQWGRYERPFKVAVLTADQRIEFTTVSPIPFQTTFDIAQQIIAAADLPAFNGHFMQTYRARIKAACNQIDDDCDLFPVTEPPPGPADKYRVTVLGHTYDEGGETYSFNPSWILERANPTDWYYESAPFASASLRLTGVSPTPESEIRLTLGDYVGGGYPAYLLFVYTGIANWYEGFESTQPPTSLFYWQHTLLTFEKVIIEPIYD